MTKFIERRINSRNVKKPVVVFYHANCTDGFTAAWVAWKNFGDQAEYIPIYHQDPLPDGLIDKEIYTLDITFPKDITEDLLRSNRRVTSIDHHVTSSEVTLMTYQPSYALDHSGAVLAWQYFFGNKKIPRLLLNVEDMDIWTRKIQGSHELLAYMDLLEFNFSVWSKLVSDFEKFFRRRRILKTGATLVAYEKKIIERQISKNARLVKFEGHTIYAINENNFQGDAATRLAESRPPFAIAWREAKDGRVIVSLRSVGDFDVSKLAEKYGGGGHKNAAAFRLISVGAIPWESAA